jgi:hypothetical protein
MDNFVDYYLALHPQPFVLESNKSRGRHLIASCDIPRGTKILVDHVYCSTTNYQPYHTPSWKLAEIVFSELRSLVSKLKSEYYHKKQTRYWKKEDDQDLNTLGKMFPDVSHKDIKIIYEVMLENSMTSQLAGNIIVCGFYPVLSYLNHSCNWNCETILSGHDYSKVLVSKENIKKGEELTIPYVHLFRNFDVKTRQHIIWTHFGFVCTCATCRRDILKIEKKDAPETSTKKKL